MIEVRDTWADRDLPVLKAVLVLSEQEPAGAVVGPAAVAKETGLSTDDVQRAFQALSPDHIRPGSSNGAGEIQYVAGVTSKGRQKAGAWPSPEEAFNRFLSALEAIAASDGVDEEQRENARESAGRLRHLGRDLGVGVLGNAIFMGAAAVPGLFI